MFILTHAHCYGVNKIRNHPDYVSTLLHNQYFVPYVCTYNTYVHTYIRIGPMQYPNVTILIHPEHTYTHKRKCIHINKHTHSDTFKDKKVCTPACVCTSTLK